MNHNGIEYSEIEIKEVSASIDTSKYNFSEINLKEGECVRNSFNVGKICQAKCIEGFVLLKVKVDDDLKGLVIRHCWNKINDSHFDISNEEIWSNNEYALQEARYFVVSERDYIDYAEFESYAGNLPFLSNAVEIAYELNIELRSLLESNTEE